MPREDKIAEVVKWEIDTDHKSTGPSCTENLLTDAENPISIQSTSQAVASGTKKLVPLPDRVAQHVNERRRESLLKSKPPFVLSPLTENHSTTLPFLRISVAIHPLPKRVADTSTSKLTDMKAIISQPWASMTQERRLHESVVI